MATKLSMALELWRDNQSGEIVTTQQMLDSVDPNDQLDSFSAVDPAEALLGMLQEVVNDACLTDPLDDDDPQCLVSKELIDRLDQLLSAIHDEPKPED